MADYYVGIDFGGTNTKLGLFDADIKLIERSSMPTDIDIEYDALVQAMALAVKHLVSDAGISVDDVKAVGLASP